MSIAVRILSGHNAPWSNEFESGEIAIGRAADADVRLHPTLDTVCASDIHAKLIALGDRWELQVLHKSGVTVETAKSGSRVLGEGEVIPIAEETQLTLGRGGPQLRLTPQAATIGTLPGTLERPDRAPPLSQISPEVVSRANKAGGRIVVASVALLAVIAVIAFAMSRRVGNVENFLDVQRNEIALNKETLRELDQDVKQSVTKVLREAAPSIYLVLAKSDDGASQGIGTAWAVGEQILATNAHVADAIASAVDEGLTCFVGSAAKPEQLIRIQETQAHPGYLTWTPVLESGLRQRNSLSGRKLELITACDVALLRVDGEIGPPLRLADRATLNDMAPGDEIGYVGYPMENIPGLPTEPTVVVGRVTRLMDFFYRTATPDNTMLIQFDAVATGGASGSPLFDRRGNVVGLLSAGSVVWTSGGRAPIGLNYGQRVDLLRELIDGTADERQDDRDGEWKARLRELVVMPEEEIPSYAGSAVAELIDSGQVGDGATFEVVTTKRQSTAVGETLPTWKFSIELKSAGIYGVFATSESWGNDIDVTIEVSDGGSTTDDSVGPIATVWLRNPSAAELNITLTAPAATSKEVEFACFVYHVKE